MNRELFLAFSSVSAWVVLLDVEQDVSVEGMSLLKESSEE